MADSEEVVMEDSSSSSQFYADGQEFILVVSRDELYCLFGLRFYLTLKI